MAKKLSKLGILEIAASIAITLVAFAVSSYLPAFRGLSYVGAFLISLVTSATILVPAPGWAIIISFGRTLDPLLLGIVAGLGSGIGELSGYILGRGSAHALETGKPKRKSKEKRGTAQKFFDSQSAFVKEYPTLAIFALAAIPNPFFDVAGIASGAIKMPWWKFLLATIAGKIVKFVVFAEFGHLSRAFF